MSRNLPNLGVQPTRYTRFLGEVLGVVVALVGWQSLSAADALAVGRPDTYNVSDYTSKGARP